MTELAVAYAKERVQFDRPIGSFQAIKHLCADMVVRTELARAAVYAAGARLDEGTERPGFDRLVSTAKLIAGEAAIANGKTATQVFGGMGYTWEVDVHLYLKRAWVLDTHFGPADQHATFARERVDYSRTHGSLADDRARRAGATPRIDPDGPYLDFEGVTYTARQMDDESTRVRARARGPRRSSTATGSQR